MATASCFSLAELLLVLCAQTTDLCSSLFVPPGLSKGTLPEVNVFELAFKKAFRFERDQTCITFLVTRDFVWGLCKGTLPKDNSFHLALFRGL